MGTFSTRGSARLGAPLALAVAFFIGGPARGQVPLTIVPTFDSSITSDPNAAAIETTINQAVQEYHNMITTTAATTVRITYAEMGSGLGESSTAITSVPYSTLRAALVSHASGANDAVALATLPVQANSPVDGQSELWVSVPNARALGLVGNSGSSDATVSLNMSIMNITRPPGNPSFFDLKAVAEHETDEVLGLGSGLNLPTGFPRQSRPQDLFRYSAPLTRSYSVSASTSYFSIDDGTTNLVGFNQQNDGSDFGDWVSGSGTARVQDAFGTAGATPNLGVELTALDVIGYNLSAVPEPGTMLLTAAGLAVAFTRRRRGKVPQAR